MNVGQNYDSLIQNQSNGSMYCFSRLLSAFFFFFFRGGGIYLLIYGFLKLIIFKYNYVFDLVFLSVYLIYLFMYNFFLKLYFIHF